VKLVDTTIAVDHLHGVPAAVELARQYRKSHSGIGAVDYLIAATAIVI
jgi:predicted nucleic acid-binding protein